jgi:hypothetical protein
VNADEMAMRKLYATGAFFFALAYPGDDLQAIAELLKISHLQQYFQVCACVHWT